MIAYASLPVSLETVEEGGLEERAELPDGDIYELRDHSIGRPCKAAQLKLFLVLAGLMTIALLLCWPQVAQSYQMRTKTPSVKWGELCDGRQWVAAVSQLAEQSAFSANQDSAGGLGSRRLYQTLLKVLCGHPIVLGVVGTSVSGGTGVDFDVHRVYAYTVWQWLQSLPMLPIARRQGRPRHGYQNAAVSGTGSDLLGLCLNSFFSLQTGVKNKLIEVEADPSPDPFGPTSVQLAKATGSKSALPDLLFVEFTANDYNSIKAGESPYFGWQNNSGTHQADHSVEVGNAETNLRRVIRKALAQKATAPFLVNTVVLESNQTELLLGEIDGIYTPVIRDFDLPSVSWYRRFVPSELSSSSQWQHTVAHVVSQHYMSDHTHLNNAGHVDLALLIIAYLQRGINHILSKHSTGTAPSRPHLSPDLDRSISSSRVPDGLEEGINPNASYCALCWAQACINREAFEEPLHISDFTRDERRTRYGDPKVSWMANTTSAELIWNCSTFVPDATTVPLIAAVAVSFLRSYAENMGSAEVWITAVRRSLSSKGQLITESEIAVSAVHLLQGRWALPQSTAVVANLPLLLPRSARSNSADEPVDFLLHVRNVEQGKRFHLIGVFVDVAI